MKKIILLIAGCFSLVTGFSQVSKGDKLIGVGLGSISYASSKSNTSYSNTPTEYDSKGSSFSISINPTVGWFVSDGLAVGTSASISYYYSSSNSSNTGNINTSKAISTQPSFYIGPFARYYFGGSSKGKPFVQAGGQYGIYGGKTKSTPNIGTGSETKTKPKGDWNAGVLVGYGHFLG
jgi:outer membrane protein